MSELHSGCHRANSFFSEQEEERARELSDDEDKKLPTKPTRGWFAPAARDDEDGNDEEEKKENAQPPVAKVAEPVVPAVKSGVYRPPVGGSGAFTTVGRNMPKMNVEDVNQFPSLEAAATLAEQKKAEEKAENERRFVQTHYCRTSISFPFQYERTKRAGRKAKRTGGKRCCA
jgi:hypothetical protein